MKQTKQINSDPLIRAGAFEKRSINEDSRTVDLVFSSEEPVVRWFGNEILDHNPKSIRLGRLEDGGAVLVDHDQADHVGVVESVKIDGDRKGRATVRFGKSARASEIFEDIKDGIRNSVSVGYRIYKAILEKEDAEGIDDYRIMDWEPLEISIVSVPADPSAKIGRSDIEQNIFEIETRQIEETKMSKENEVIEKPAPVVDVQAERNQAAELERKRVSEINKLARDHGMIEIGDNFIEQGRSAEDFRAVVETVERQAPSIEDKTPVTELGLDNKETQRYSMMKAIRAFVNNDWKGAEFERECSIEIADQLGREARGFFVPFEVQKRVMNVTTGADFIGTDHLAGSFIDNLRDQAVVGAAGATFLPGLLGNVDIPKKAGSATFSWLTDDADATLTDLTDGSVTLTPKTVAGGVAMSRRLMKQSSPSIEQMVMNDLVEGAALAIDLAALEGSGAAGEPLGIVNQVGVNTQTIAASATTGYPTWAELVGFETAVAADKALRGSLRYITTAGIRGGLKTTAKDSGSGLFLMEGGEANGYEVMTSEQLTAKTIIFGNFNDVLIGMWGVLDVMPDTAAKAASGGLVLRVFQDIDVAVRHAESFCING